MRCPKCGYISFDQQETCSKCGKAINLDKINILGTVYDISSPNFLNMEGDEADSGHEDVFDHAFSDNDETEIINDLDMEGLGDDSSDLDDDDLEFDMGDPDLDEMDLNDLGDNEETTELQFSDFEDSDETLALEDEGTLELEQAGETLELETAEAEPELDFSSGADEEEPMFDLQMDDDTPAAAKDEAPEFSIADDLDFSDLKPPADEEFSFGQQDATIMMDDLDTPAPPKKQAAQPAAASASKAAGADLEDLKIEGFKLEGSSLPAQPANKAKASTKNVKTGTALDDFEIDLGDLFSNDD